MSKKKFRNVVYSTNPDYDYELDEDVEEETLPNSEQLLYVSIDRKQRKGKEVTLITGFVGAQEDLKDLERKLKSSCGVGGSSKDGDILIQGNHRDKVVDILMKDGYKAKKKGG